MIYSQKLNIVIVNYCLCENEWFKSRPAGVPGQRPRTPRQSQDTADREPAHPHPHEERPRNPKRNQKQANSRLGECHQHE